ncbi:MAG: sodium/proton antiporter NhaB [Planctomycetes bacterium]|nr:sodium/proton antiporter NhaB [Planctomycetota bacterium]MCC7171451.1 sodium/proton antiporter NhaB [Planctomycetota bacterium]
MQSTTPGAGHAQALASGSLWFRVFMGHSAPWYKRAILAFLVLNPLLYFGLKAAVGADTAGFAVGWLVLLEFIFTLALALKCYPLLPAGLLTMEALVLGLTSPDHMFKEAEHNFPVILLLVFVVAGVNFLKEWLAVVFTAILFSTRSKTVLSLLFCMAGALLSAFLDALTVTAVIIAVCKAFYDVYADWRSRVGQSDDAPLDEFRAFLRSLVMHALVGTALGGVMTMVGEPQNLLIAKQMSSLLPPDRAEHWGFVGFVIHMAVITVPTLIVGLTTTILCEKLKLFGHGAQMPDEVRRVLQESADAQRAARTSADRFRLNVQGACAILLVLGLAFHVAEVGILGLFLIVLATAFTGVSEEHRIGHAFTESLPFTALLVVFFGIVAMIADQDLFRPVIDVALAQQARGQLIAFFGSSALLSAISDNVFVATVFINEASAAFTANRIDADQFEKLAIAINCGTNVPSIATPNGQAAFLFMLTSALAAPIKLDYVRMIKMALPYTITMTAASLTAVWLWL